MSVGVTQISASTAAAAHALCFAGLAAGHALAGRGALISNPALALRLLVVCEAPVVIVVFSYLRRDPKSCSFFKAAVRGLIGLPIGALLNAFGAIVLGAPVGIKYWMVTIYWSLLMSLFTFVPAACVFGASKIDWQNVLSHSIYFTPTEVDNYMISAPCHGAVLGAWLGAWPMPLDWERPWQEWPICVTYGAIAGRLVGMAVSLVLIAVHKRSRNEKTQYMLNKVHFNHRMLNEKSASAISISTALDGATLLPSGSSLCIRCWSATGYMSPSSCSRPGDDGALWGSSDLPLYLCSRCTGELPRLGDVARLWLGVVSVLIKPSKADVSRCFTFSLAALRHFITAFAVCSSKMVFFMCEPICAHEIEFGCDPMLLNLFHSQKELCGGSTSTDR
ncbi:hypothetical protein U9M48_005971 [Paspalum notatum var. saurae]|uniref:Phosphatidylinositol-glycan biosynthesis class F protein n=1 Tax=Paspalum notatum var. saurae TaxID=547442 RepID=A0AAQ3PR88_PASNO